MSAGERLCAICESVYSPGHVPADGRCTEPRCFGTLVSHSGPLEWFSLLCGLGSVVAGSLAFASYMEYLQLPWRSCSVAAACTAGVGLLTSFLRQTRISHWTRGVSALAVGLIYPPFVLLTLILFGVGMAVVMAGVFGDEGGGAYGEYV